MMDEIVVKVDAGLPFADGEDRGRIVVSSRSTNGAYSVMEWVVAPGSGPELDQGGFGPHLHGSLEETFLIRSGELEFLVDETVTVLSAGDFVRVPPGTRHGYRNATRSPVDMIVTFVPGGFEELFVRYRTDQEEQTSPSDFLADAIRDFDSSFE